MGRCTRNHPRFQSTHPSGVRLLRRQIRVIAGEFQSTHPSGVRLLVFDPCGLFGDISIHAPQWGATLSARGRQAGRAYFNPRTPVGCDCCVVRLMTACRYFNPRTPVGCDNRYSVCSVLRKISIHAPQWGATRSSRSSTPRREDFNPRTPVGCDRASSSAWRRRSNFNPRTPVGCDATPQPTAGAPGSISIHAPQWGATWSAASMHLRHGFQSTHPSGVRLALLTVQRQQGLFQSTHPSGVRQVDIKAYDFTLRFQSTHPSGVRRTTSGRACGSANFNPRTPVGCDRRCCRCRA